MVVTGITYKCNFDCLFCLDRKHKQKEDLSFKQIKDLFFKIKHNHENTIMLMTGESFIRPDFFEILRLAKKYNLRVRVTTNGVMLSSYDFLAKIAKDSVTQINFSLHSHIPRVANALSRNNRCYLLQRKALMNIDKFNSTQKMEKNRIKLHINTVICEMNYKDLEGQVYYIKDLLKYTTFKIKFKVMIRGGNDSVFYKKMLPSFGKVKPYLSKALSVLQKGNITLSGFPLCIAPSYEKVSVWLNEKLYCSNLYLNSYNINEFKDCKTYHAVLEEDFYRYKECKSCSLYSICPGVRKDYSEVYPDFNLKLSRRKVSDVLRQIKKYRGSKEKNKENIA